MRVAIKNMRIINNLEMCMNSQQRKKGKQNCLQDMYKKTLVDNILITYLPLNNDDKPRANGMTQESSVRVGKYLKL